LVRKLNQKIKDASKLEQQQVRQTFKDKTSDETKRTHESIKTDMLVITEEQQEHENKKKEKRKKEESDSQDENDMEQSENKHLDLKA